MDFYLILPSNACANIHPNNTASKFFVSFNEAISINPNDGWKVALTEIHFNDVMLTMDTAHGFEYMEMVAEVAIKTDIKILWNGYFQVQWPSKDSPDQRKQSLFHLIVSDFHAETDKKVMFLNATRKFTVKFHDAALAKALGFTEMSYNSSYDEVSKSFMVRADKNYSFKKDSKYEIIVTMTYFDPPNLEVKKLMFPRGMQFTNDADLLSYLQKELKPLFSNITYNKYIEMTVKSPDIKQVKFLNGTNIILGVRELVHDIDKNNLTIKGNAKFALDRGITKFLVYASVCAPVQVGDVRVPLLKMLSLNTDNKKGYQNVSIRNPMYLPVSQESINSVEVNIRSDSGELIPFVPGSVTTLTLHFKKT